MKHLIAPAVIVSFSAANALSQTVLDFYPQHSGMRSQGSKIDLVFDPFTDRPTVAVPDDLTITIEYPVYGSNTPTVQKEIRCLGIQWQRNQSLGLDVITACLEGEIHDTDELVTVNISLDQGWATFTNQTVNEQSESITNFALTNESAVDYPKPIASWDMVPHQIYKDPFHVDLVVFHRHSFEHSEFGDFDVDVWIDGNAAQENDPPSNGPKLVATARPSFKVPERNDIHAGTYLIYRATFDPDQYLNGSSIVDGPAYVHFKITPSRGDADSVLVSPGNHLQHEWDPADLPTADPNNPDIIRVQPNIETMKIFMNGGETLDPPLYAVVDDSLDIDEDGVWDDDDTVARANAYGTMYGALQDLPADTDGPLFILLTAGRHWSAKAPGSTAGNADIPGNHWLTIMPDSLDDPPVTRDEVEITDVAFFVSSPAPHALNDLLELHNDTDGHFEWSWQSGGTMGESDGLRIRSVTGDPFDKTFPRDGLTVAQLVADINGEGIDGLSADFATGLGGISVDQVDRYYDADTGFTQIDQGQDGFVQAHSIIETFDNGEVYVFAELKEELYPNTLADVAALVLAIDADFTHLTPVAVHGQIELAQLEPHRYNVPDGFKEGQIVWFDADVGAGPKYPYIRFFDCWIRSTQVQTTHLPAAPRHLWMDNVVFKHESPSSLDSSVVTAAAGQWRGGIWYTRCNFDTLSKSATGPVMIRDAWFKNIGGDTGKQVSYAMNWFAEDVREDEGDPVHPDYFQWSFLEPDSQPQIESGDHGNIIAVNLDFRDEDNDGQPFLLNVPDNEDTAHWYRGVAFVNLRMNAPRTQQICGNVDHFLLWDSDVFQDSASNRFVQLRGVPRTEAENTSIYHNVSIRNTVVESVHIDGESDGQFAGDMPSLWAILDTSHITTELVDEQREIPDEEIMLYPGCDDGSSPSALVDLDADWSPEPPLQGQPSLLDRVAAGQIVYRMDAAGKERVIDEQPLAAVGAMEDPIESDGQPCELDLYLIATGSLSSAGVPDDNPLSALVISDDRKLSVLSAGLSPVADLVVYGKTQVASPSAIDLVFEGRIGSGNMNNAKLRLWNFNAIPPAWDDVDTFTISTTEAVRIKTDIATTNYIEEGEIRFSIYLAPSFWISPNFTLQADQMKIVVKD